LFLFLFYTDQQPSMVFKPQLGELNDKHCDS
jgi:hypothetical protein